MLRSKDIFQSIAKREAQAPRFDDVYDFDSASGVMGRMIYFLAHRFPRAFFPALRSRTMRIVSLR